LPKSESLAVKELAFNGFDTEVKFYQYSDRIHTVEDLLIVMDCGLWDAIDLLRIEFTNGQQIALISNRKVGLEGKKTLSKILCKQT
jgi:uncharacterized protein (DUF927 family)